MEIINKYYDTKQLLITHFVKRQEYRYTILNLRSAGIDRLEWRRSLYIRHLIVYKLYVVITILLNNEYNTLFLCIIIKCAKIDTIKRS
jgi:hypothetical protein